MRMKQYWTDSLLSARRIRIDKSLISESAGLGDAPENVGQWCVNN